MRFTPAAALAAVFAISAAACSENPTEVRPVDAAPDLSVSTSSAQVTVLPSQSIQAAVNAHPAGTTFLLKAGTFRGQTVVPKSGDVFIGEKGTVLDGAGRTFAFDMGNAPYPSNVRIQGLTIQNYAPGFQAGAVHAGRAGGNLSSRSTGWVVSSCEIRNNRGAGVDFGNRMQVLNNNIHHNDQIGARGSGDDILFQGNEVSYNNPSWHYRPEGTGREFGGIKFSHTHGLVARGNYVHHNNGNGLWTDIDNINALYDANRAVSNAGVGIMHEISYAVVVRNNVATGNGFSRGGAYGAGILISNSSDAEVYGNTVSGNKMGITANDLNRGSGKYGPYVVHNLYVHDNTVQTGGQSGIQGGAGTGVYTTWNNHFEHNTYTGLASNRTPFLWAGSRRTIAQWQGYGHDRTGTFQP
jgi:parallel beta-helix repeat protein